MGETVLDKCHLQKRGKYTINPQPKTIFLQESVFLIMYQSFKFCFCRERFAQHCNLLGHTDRTHL